MLENAPGICRHGRPGKFGSIRSTKKLLKWIPRRHREKGQGVCKIFRGCGTRAGDCNASSRYVRMTSESSERKQSLHFVCRSSEARLFTADRAGQRVMPVVRAQPQPVTPKTPKDPRHQRTKKAATAINSGDKLDQLLLNGGRQANHPFNGVRPVFVSGRIPTITFNCSKRPSNEKRPPA